MRKVEVINNDILDETIYKTKLKNGLEIFICKKVGFLKKIGMFGTKYGSLNNVFTDIYTNERVTVPDGIAHFLEHKLFEKEEENAMEQFSKIGVSSNAYTSFDKTVYYFETNTKFEESINLLVNLIRKPYFTDENVAKEQGIIAQEIKMYEDEPDYNVYFNTINALYKEHPIKVDIAGTVESISQITKELLYQCYNNFYNSNNMFFIVIGDVDVEATFDLIEKNIIDLEPNFYNNKNLPTVVSNIKAESRDINTNRIEKNMDIYMPQICFGYKLDVVVGDMILKSAQIFDIIDEMYFSKTSDFYNELYSKGLLNVPISLEYEGTKSFSHILISAQSLNLEKIEKELNDYIIKLKNIEIDNQLFENIKKKKIGKLIFESENLDYSSRIIIDSIIDNTNLYKNLEILNNISTNDIKDALLLLDDKYKVVSTLKPN